MSETREVNIPPLTFPIKSKILAEIIRVPTGSEALAAQFPGSCPFRWTISVFVKPSRGQRADLGAGSTQKPRSVHELGADHWDGEDISGRRDYQSYIFLLGGIKSTSLHRIQGPRRNQEKTWILRKEVGQSSVTCLQDLHLWNGKW